MKKIIGILAFSFLFFVSNAQEEEKQFIHKGILRATGTITPGLLLKENASSISIHGNLEYYIADKVSIRGDGFYYLGGSFWNSFHYNHSLFSGASYHFETNNNFDPYVSIAPGLSITKGQDFSKVFCDPNPCPYSGKTSANPVISSVIGFNYYFQRWFHLFAETRYINGKYLSDSPKPISLSELRFSFGLGFNLSVFKPK